MQKTLLSTKSVHNLEILKILHSILKFFKICNIELIALNLFLSLEKCFLLYPIINYICFQLV